MSDYEALIQFNKKPVSNEMINFLAATTESIINIQNTRSMISIALPAPQLCNFIKKLVLHSNVQTPTLMATTVYLAKLRAIIPNTVYGIETTRHRIFLGCLILAAKTLNDSSPLNKHWTKYTDGLLSIREVNTIERELLEYFDWNVSIQTEHLTSCLAPLLKPIVEQQQLLRANASAKNNLPCFNSQTPGQIKYYINSNVKSHHRQNSSISSVSSATSSTASINILHARSNSNYSLPSLASSSSLSTIDSKRSKYSSNIQMIPEEQQYNNPYKASLENRENSNSTMPVKPLIIRNSLIKVTPVSNVTENNFSSSSWASFV